MIRKRLSMNTRVCVSLGGRGRRILGEFLSPDAPEDRRFYRSDTAYMTLWEVLRIFGPHCNSSLHADGVVPMLEYDAPDDERRLRALAKELEHALRTVMVVLSGGGTHYLAPERLTGAAESWARASVRLIPDREGWWWLGDQVVRVDVQSGSPMVLLRNGRRKPVSEFDDWRGQAMVDPRVAQFIRAREAEGSGEIPF